MLCGVGFLSGSLTALLTAFAFITVGPGLK